MKCPVCKDKSLTTTSLEQGLPAHACAECHGSWIEALPYADWATSQASSTEGGGTNIDEDQASLVSGEGRGIKFCPHCSHVLIKYKVGSDAGFSIDRCGHCAGVWLDKNEWQILKSQRLHEKVRYVFSDEWQSDVRAAEHAKAMDEILLERLGSADYAEFKRVKAWLDSHAKSEELYALLYGSRHDLKTRARSF